MTDRDGVLDGAWECGWDEHERAQALRLSILPLWQKIAWLEQAHRIALHLSQARQTHDETTSKRSSP